MRIMNTTGHYLGLGADPTLEEVMAASGGVQGQNLDFPWYTGLGPDAQVAAASAIMPVNATPNIWTQLQKTLGVSSQILGVAAGVLILALVLGKRR